jgi:hypothetical protein
VRKVLQPQPKHSDMICTLTSPRISVSSPKKSGVGRGGGGGGRQWWHAGPPLLGVGVDYCSCLGDGNDDKEEEEEEDDTFNNGNVLGREVGRQWKGVGVSDVSGNNTGGGGAAMTKYETPRFSNICEWSWGDDDVRQ